MEENDYINGTRLGMILSANKILSNFTPEIVDGISTAEFYKATKILAKIEKKLFKKLNQ